MPEKSPITVTVKFFGGIRHTAGFARMPMTFSGQHLNVGDLLDTLAARSPDLHRTIEKGVKGGYINILLNGRNIRFLNGLTTPLADGDALAFLPPVGGG